MKNPGRQISIILIIIMTVILILPGCTEKATAVETNLMEDETYYSLTIDYMGQEIIISMDEISELPQAEREVTPVPKDDGEPQARLVKGVILEDVLQRFAGISQKEPQALRLIAGDGYSIEVSSDLLQTREIILANEIDGKPLEGWEKPLWSIVPDVFEMYWVKNLLEIEVVTSRTSLEIDRIVIMESRISYIPDQEYDYYGDTDRAVKISDLLLEYGEDPENVYARAADGLEKNEKPEIFKDAYLKYTGEDSPIFLSQDLPKGMWIKKIMFFTYGSSAYLSAVAGMEAMDIESINNVESILLSDIFKECGIKQADSYILKAVNNYSAEIEAGSVSLGYIYLQENGLPAAAFKGMDGSSKVKDLLYIEVME